MPGESKERPVKCASFEKANELTVSARTELEKIQAIARYVQSIQYISIQIGVGRWRPHAASEVLAKSYGDCKDKPNLMRALFKVLNITSYPVLIYSGDPSFVQEIWPSPRQFNHCIIAIKVGDETQVATILNHPPFGRLLIFDATDDNTPIGDLPDHEQGSLALIAAGDSGALVRMPSTLPETNQLDRSAASAAFRGRLDRRDSKKNARLVSLRSTIAASTEGYRNRII